MTLVRAAMQCCMYRIFRILALAAIVHVVDAKVATGVMHVGGTEAETEWRYVTKFGVSVGQGSYTARIKITNPDYRKLEKPAILNLDMFLDDDWDATPNIETLPACGPEGRSSKAVQSLSLTLDPDGAWSSLESGVLKAQTRPYIAYFVFSDCRKDFGDEFPRRIQYEIQALQHDGCHFSFELRYMVRINYFVLAIFAVYIVYFGCRCFFFYQSAGSFHPVLMVLSGVIVVHFIAETFHMLNLFVYSIDGKGMKPVEMLSEVLFMLAQVLVTSLFLCIGLGYTLLEWKETDMETVVALTAMIFAVHASLVSLGHLDESSGKHHHNEGMIGYAILVIRLLLYCWFMWGVRKTNEAGGLRIQAFLNKFGTIGSCYFLAYPCIFGCAHLCPAYYQHPVMQVGLLIMQFASIAWLSQLFLGRGEYFKLSTLNASSLPSGQRAGVPKGA